MARRTWGAYFSIISALLLFLSVVAFSDNLFTDVTQPSNSDPKFIVHGLFGLAWYVLLVVQSNLARVHNLRFHKKLGVSTFLVAIGVTLSTLYLFVVLWNGWANTTGEARANRLFLPAYAMCLSLAWLWRGQPDWHKRLIFTGTFFMLGPVLARAYDPLVVAWMEPLFPTFSATMVSMSMDFAGLQADPAFLVFFYGVWIGFFLSLVFYDWKTLKRIHPVTIAGPVWFVLAWLIALFT